MGTGSFQGVKCGRGVLLTTHPLLVPWSWKSRAIPLPTLWATTGPVKGTLYFYFTILEVYTQFRWGNLRERDHLENPDVDARLILILILRK